MATRTSVLIIGDSQIAGWLADAIHQSSPRGGGSLVRVNCDAMAPAPLAYELFGWPLPEQGTDPRVGLVGEAHGGTLFLQNIQATDLRIQFLLAEVLKDRQYIRTGDDTPRPADIRLIASATTRLEGRVAAGQFRADLFYHLNVVCIVLPAALQKSQDMAQVLEFFRAQAHGQSPATKGSDPWTGPALEVRRVLEDLFAQSPGITIQAILPTLLQVWNPSSISPSVPELTGDAAALEQKLLQVVEQTAATGGEPFEQLVSRLQKKFLQQILQDAGGVEAKAAELLGISPPVLASKMRELGLAQGG